MPDESLLASIAIDNIKIEKLVREFLNAQSLKILPQAPFGDAVGQFVDKDDKHAVENFLNQSLAGQQKHMFELDNDEEDLDGIMEQHKARIEQKFLNGTYKRMSERGHLKPKPDYWDTDHDGNWEDQPGAFEMAAEDQDEDATPAPAGRRGRRSLTELSNDEEAEEAVPSKKAPPKRAPPKKAPAKAAPKKAATKPLPKGRKKAVTVEISDDEDEDVIMMEPSLQSKRAVPARSTGRQTQLNFSQAKSQPKELSDDEISDDDDAFEPMPSSRRR
jgi:double-strand break repair protein MRE11